MTSFTELLVLKLSIEEEFDLETKSREPYEIKDTEKLREVASLLIRKTLIQDKLISKCMTYIGELEVKKVMDHVDQSEYQKPFWKKIIGL